MNRNARLLSDYKKAILHTTVKRTLSILAAIVLILALSLGGLAACRQPISGINDLDFLEEKYIASPFIAIILSKTWTEPAKISPDRLLDFACDQLLREGKDFGEYITFDDAIMVPEDLIESTVLAHFGVTIEHMRTADSYDGDQKAYEFGGLGSATTPKLDKAEQKGNKLTLQYSVTGAQGNLLGKGTLIVEVNEKKDSYKYLSCQYTDAPSNVLKFPSAENVVVLDSSVTMNSGAVTGRGETRNSLTYYDGSRLADIVNFYTKEAIPALKATGSVVEGKIKNGWAWQGSYDGGKPLIIEVIPNGSDYNISIVFDSGKVK